MHLTVKWGKERALFQYEDPLIPLRDLKIWVSEWTHLPLESLKLIHSGAILQGDDHPLSSYRFRPNATIQVVGSAQIPAPAGPAQNLETSILSQIQEQLASVRSNLAPSLHVFLEALPTQDSTINFTKEHARLSELLLQSLLKLDAITVESEWEQARQERKAAVKEVQGYLDQLDEAWNTKISVQ